MKYLLDTDTRVYLIKRHPPQVRERLRRHRLSSVALSSIVVSELSWGAAKSGSRRNVEALDAFVAAFEASPTTRPRPSLMAACARNWNAPARPSARWTC